MLIFDKYFNIVAIRVLFIILYISAFCTAVHAQNGARKSSAEDSTQTAITWKKQTFDLGKIKQGERKELEYIFINTGNAPLVIISVYPSCGCTAASFPKEPVLPGEKGIIKVVFNAGTKRAFKETATLLANIPNEQATLTLQGIVE